MQIMDAMTSLDPHVEDSDVLAMDDPELLKYPVSYMVEAASGSRTTRRPRRSART